MASVRKLSQLYIERWYHQVSLSITRRIACHSFAGPTVIPSFKIKSGKVYYFLLPAATTFFIVYAHGMASVGRFHGKSNHELVRYLKKEGIIKSDRVYEAMNSIDRGNYTHPSHAYVDAPQGIGYGVTISAPHMHAHALELLSEKLQNGARALDVGSGSGYLTACMGKMVGPNGLAVGIDHIPELRAMAMENIKHDNPELLRNGHVELVVGDGRLGYAKKAPYDAIHVGAAAKEMPEKLIEQLAPGGRMIIPIGPEKYDQTLTQIDKTMDGRIKQRSLMGVVFVPLTDKERQYRS